MTDLSIMRHLLLSLNTKILLLYKFKMHSQDASEQLARSPTSLSQIAIFEIRIQSKDESIRQTRILGQLEESYNEL